MTIQEAKDEVAQNHGFDNWSKLTSTIIAAQTTIPDDTYDEIAELYASSRNRELEQALRDARPFILKGPLGQHERLVLNNIDSLLSKPGSTELKKP
jgi:hypothetical protein